MFNKLIQAAVITILIGVLSTEGTQRMIQPPPTNHPAPTPLASRSLLHLFERQW